jgi:F-type H+-transporting ATPase subunit alpha
MANDIIENLRRDIEGYRRGIQSEKIGRVAEAGDGIARIWGLSDVASGEMIEIETSEGTVSGIAFNLEEDTVGAVILGNAESVREGNTARRLGRVLSVRVGKELVGRAVDPLGRPLDGRGPVFQKETEEIFFPLEREAPSVIEREPVATPIHTGIKAIDAMIPIGRGQRELLIGDRGTGKTSIAIDAIINQGRDTRFRTPICIYAAIGQKESKIAKTMAALEREGAMSYTIVISSPASSPASLWYLAPFAACAIGEYFMAQGDDVLVVYDDLSKHAWSYRELSLLLRRPPGREAYPGDIFYLHARLLERAAKLNSQKGGGSLTALPIIETQLGDVSAYIPTNVISITDGQIYLEPELFHQGIRPAVNVGLSVSRVGAAAQTKAMKKVAGRLRLELAQFRELAAFSQFASDLDESTRRRLQRGRALTEILKQGEREPVPFEEAVCLVFSATSGFFDDTASQDIQARAKEFLEFLRKLHGKDVFEPIRASGDFSSETEAALAKAMESFRSVKK